MITRFHIKNFRSIVDLELDFTYGEGKAPNGYKNDPRLAFLEARTKEHRDKPLRAVPVMAYYGLNAGGKSTIFAAFAALKRILMSGIEGQFQPNKLHRELVPETTLEMEWVIADEQAGSSLCQYSISYTAETITAESFQLDGLTLFRTHKGILKEERLSATQNLVFTADRVAEIYRTTCTEAINVQVQPILSTFTRQFPGLHLRLPQVTESLHKVIIIPDATFLASLISSRDIQTTMLSDAAIETAGRSIRKMDIDIERVYSRPEKYSSINPHTGQPELREVKQVYVEHRSHDGKLESLRIQEESKGTQTLFMLLCALESMQNNQAIFLIDELDNALHPLLLREIVSRFTSKEHNPNSSQLIFSAHNTDLLDGQRLRSSEVGIVSKTRAKGTMVDRLCDINGVRNVDNFRKDYLNGEYSGIPFIATTCP